MIDRNVLIRTIWSMSRLSMEQISESLGAIDRAGYEVTPKRPAVEALNEVRAAFDAHDQALIDAAARKGAAMALRAWHAAAVGLYEREDNELYMAVLAQADRIERGET